MKVNVAVKVKYKRSFKHLRNLAANPMREFKMNGNLDIFMKYFSKKVQSRLRQNYRKSGFRFRKGERGIKGALISEYKIGYKYAHIGVGPLKKLNRLVGKYSKVPYWKILNYGTMRSTPYIIQPRYKNFLVFKASRSKKMPIFRCAYSDITGKSPRKFKSYRSGSVVRTKFVVHYGIHRSTPALFFERTAKWAKRNFKKELAKVVKQYFKLIGLRPIGGVRF